MRGVVVDIETTGFSKEDAITSISLIKFFGYRIDDIFSSLVNPGMKIPEKIVKLTGITDVMVLGFPNFSGELTNEIKKFLSGQPLFAYNAPFEARFLKNIFLREVKVNDVMNAVRKHFRFDKNRKLIEAAKYFKLETREVHTSLNDALICFNLINILVKSGYRWEI